MPTSKGVAKPGQTDADPQDWVDSLPRNRSGARDEQMNIPGRVGTNRYRYVTGEEKQYREIYDKAWSKAREEDGKQRYGKKGVVAPHLYNEWTDM
jgi:hypothetical protein